MANERKGEVSIELGGETHLLRLDWGAVAEVQRETAARNLIELNDGLAMCDLRAIMSGLTHGLIGGGMDVRAASKLVRGLSGQDVARVRDAVSQALNLTFDIQPTREGEAGEGKAQPNTKT